MIKFLLSLSLFFAAGSNLQAASDTIWWSTQRLKWTDFKAKSDTAVDNKDHFATTLWKLTYFHRYNARSGQAEVICYAWFDGRRSWVRSTQKTNEALLQHEQGHFDLAEILARQFKKRIAKSSFLSRGYADSMQVIFNDLYAELNDTQLQYDIDTNFGEKPAEQRQWLTKIAALLAKLADYADKRVLSKVP